MCTEFEFLIWVVFKVNNKLIYLSSGLTSGFIFLTSFALSGLVEVVKSEQSHYTKERSVSLARRRQGGEDCGDDVAIAKFHKYERQAWVAGRTDECTQDQLERDKERKDQVPSVSAGRVRDHRLLALVERERGPADDDKGVYQAVDDDSEGEIVCLNYSAVDKGNGDVLEHVVGKRVDSTTHYLDHTVHLPEVKHLGDELDIVVRDAFSVKTGLNFVNDTASFVSSLRVVILCGGGVFHFGLRSSVNL